MSNLEGIRTHSVEELERAPRRPATIEDLRAAEERAIFELRIKLAAAAAEQQKENQK